MGPIGRPKKALPSPRPPLNLIFYREKNLREKKGVFCQASDEITLPPPPPYGTLNLDFNSPNLLVLDR
jgi:hypothetical protein